MKVLFLSPTGAIGGAEQVLLSTLSALRQARLEAECHLLCLSDGPLIARAQALGVQAMALPAPGGFQSFGDSEGHRHGRRALGLAGLLWRGLATSWNAWRYARRLRRQISDIGPDLIHSNGVKTHALLWLAGVRDIPVLWHVHDFLSRRPLARRLLSRAVRGAAGAIAISGAVAEDLKRLWPTLPVHTVPNAVDTRHFFPGPGDGNLLDRLAGMPPRDCLRVGLVATFARWKGHDVFLAAAARVLQARPAVPVRFYIVGGPIYQTRGSQFDLAELRELAEKLGIGADVGFIGFQTDVPSVYRALDIIVHASTAPEPFGLTIIEAMACGKAVVAVPEGGAAEIFRPGVDAVGVPPSDAGALADAIAYLIANPELRRSIGSHARQTIERNCTLDRFRTDLSGVLDPFLGRDLIECANHEESLDGLLHADSL